MANGLNAGVKDKITCYYEEGFYKHDQGVSCPESRQGRDGTDLVITSIFFAALRLRSATVKKDSPVPVRTGPGGRPVRRAFYPLREGTISRTYGTLNYLIVISINI